MKPDLIFRAGQGIVKSETAPCATASTSSASKTRATKKTKGSGEQLQSGGGLTSSTEAGTAAPKGKSRKATRSSSPKVQKTKNQAPTATTIAPTSDQLARLAELEDKAAKRREQVKLAVRRHRAKKKERK
jgi:hypothetical protein